MVCRNRAALAAGVFSLVAVAGALAPAWAADPPAPISPIAPVAPTFAPFAPPSSSFAPIRPVTPVLPSGESGTSVGTGESLSRSGTGTGGGFAPPAAPSGLSRVQERIAAVSASVSALLARLGAVGQSDGQPFSELSAQQAAQALREGRGVFAGEVSAPQVQVDAEGCPVSVPEGTLREGADLVGAAQLCEASVAQAATPEAAQAIKWAFTQLGAPYACGGVGRLEPYRFDCSSLVARAYFEGAGLSTATKTWSPSTRELMPWDGAKLATWADFVEPENVRPGDLLLYRTCDDGRCSYQHVVMALADGYMLHTNRCGDVAHVTKSWGTGPEKNFVVARRVNPEAAR